MSNHYQIELEEHPIELYKLLKIANLVSGGGEAKMIISNGYILLNGEIETQKRKKIYSGDIIEFNNDLIELICHAQPTEKAPRIKQKQDTTNSMSMAVTDKNHAKFQKPHKNTNNSSNINNGQRRKINFD